MEQKLLNFQRVCGLVDGAFGKISEVFKLLMDDMSNQKKQELEAQTGLKNRRSVTAQLASYTSQNQQKLSRVCVQAQARRVLVKLAGLGGGARL